MLEPVVTPVVGVEEVPAIAAMVGAVLEGEVVLGVAVVALQPPQPVEVVGQPPGAFRVPLQLHGGQLGSCSKI
jgi:hypothetical protein